MVHMTLRAVAWVVLVLGSLVTEAFVVNTCPARPSVSMMVKRPQLKAAKKANRLRPRKKRPSDIYRKAPSFNVEPQYYDGRPDEYTVISEGSDDFDKNAHIEAVLARLEAEPEYDNTNPEEEAEILAAILYPDPAKAYVATQKKFKVA